MYIKEPAPIEQLLIKPVMKWLSHSFPSIRREVSYYMPRQHQRPTVDVAGFSDKYEDPFSVAVEVKARRRDHYEGPLYGLPQALHYQRVFHRVYMATNVSLDEPLITQHNRMALEHVGIGYLWVDLSTDTVHEQLKPQPEQNGWFDEELFHQAIWNTHTPHARKKGAPWIPRSWA